jgi:hypothetical protein
MPAAKYHADPCPEPSASSGVIRTLLDESPHHAWVKHPKLNPDAMGELAVKQFDHGDVVHKLSLGAGDEIAVLPFENYRTKAAQESRDEAYASDRIPVLERELAGLQRLAQPMREAMESYLGFPIDECHRELVLCWTENGRWRRIMVDIVTPDLRRAMDAKSTKVSLHPTSLTRHLYASGYDVQAAFYMRGLDKLDPDKAGRRKWAFQFGETQEPHAVSSPIELSEAGWTVARSKVEVGLAKWDACLAIGMWPGFSPEPYVAEPPTWHATQWEERLNSDETLNA